ncbi:MAG: M20/M25/M40 family metallo-hydrolase, partial [Pseudomonadota bacterium]|nr:M20/M25/M40 family metallo-hydrolase [Pseudomonadota bacterium]
MTSTQSLVLITLLFAIPGIGFAGGLDPTEAKIVEIIDSQAEEAIGFLARAVDINSGTLNAEGVRQVGELYNEAFATLGFDSRLIEQPEELQRGPHLFAEIDGTQGKRILLIGHLDTVFEPDSPFQTMRIEGNKAFGPGTEDMKGGNNVVLFALEALHEAGVLENTRIIVAFTGDEEYPGRPLDISRRDLIAAGQRADIALGFEAGVREMRIATIARRGSSGWLLEVTARPAHSSQIFKEGYGAGAIYEASRILHTFYAQLRGEQYLTFNPGAIVGGTETSYDRQESRGTAFGKSNVIAETAVVDGDLRFISEEQKARARETMSAIVALSLPETEAKISFFDGYPAMEPTEANSRLMETLGEVLR